MSHNEYSSLVKIIIDLESKYLPELISNNSTVDIGNFLSCVRREVKTIDTARTIKFELIKILTYLKFESPEIFLSDVKSSYSQLEMNNVGSKISKLKIELTENLDIIKSRQLCFEILTILKQ